MKPFYDYIIKRKNKIILSVMIFFSFFCAITIGQAWDEGFHLIQGKVILNYLLSFGRIDQEILYRENYSAIYWSLSHFITNFFPRRFELEVSHVINTIFSIFTIIGIGKISKEIFNKRVGQITFLLLFFFPVFFGHMAINSKDTILAFCHVWIVWSFLKYMKFQDIDNKSNYYIYSIALLAATGTGIQLVFLGSILPIIFFFIIDILFLKLFIEEKFNIKKFFLDILKCFILFYIILLFFWVDAHKNPLTLPYKFLLETFSDNYWTGWPFSLINGEYIISTNTPKTYLISNLLFKTPEYILFLYIFFFYIFITKNKFLSKRYSFFNKKILFVFLILIFPHLLLFFVPYPLYDGLRLFLWVIPYFCILPAVSINYFIEKFEFKTIKFLSTITTCLCLFFLLNFFSLTPYQYTYLNVFAGNKNLLHKKFENDYWGASIKELISNTNFSKDEKILLYSCGMNGGVLDKYLSIKYKNNFKMVPLENANYIFMTNRTLMDDNGLPTNCYDKFPGKNIYSVTKNNVILSVVRKL